MSDTRIIDACRTPRDSGKHGKGAPAHHHAQHLGLHAGGGMAPTIIIDRVRR